MKIYPEICNNIVIPMSDTILGTDVAGRLNRYKKFQWYSRREIDAYKHKRFLELIETVVSEVPYYSNYLSENRLSIDDFTGVDDLVKLPVLDKGMIREFAEKLHVGSFSDKVYQMKSSGSTGEPTSVYIDDSINSDVFSTQLLFWSWGV